MSEKSLPEIIEENKRVLRAEYEKGYLVGFKEAEKRSIGEFLEDLKLTHPMIGFKYTRLELIEKWEDKV